MNLLLWNSVKIIFQILNGEKNGYEMSDEN